MKVKELTAFQVVRLRHGLSEMAVAVDKFGTPLAHQGLTPLPPQDSSAGRWPAPDHPVVPASGR
ncbi:hypothetical protein, partial [Stenotrophomonas sp. SAM-B]|uniref:hypothetical protein n=1 Tax=Stenotrophomonas sp. SAM-B TaxID=2729141 RepID=UPI0019D55D3A